MRFGRVDSRNRNHVLKAYYVPGIILGSVTEGEAKLPRS